MCNLNIFIKTFKKNGDKLNNLTNFLNCSTSTSFIMNNDGDGVYFDFEDKLIKSKNKINFINHKNLIRKSNFILSHQRLATHGLSHKYTQPFKSEEFVLLHNGILSEFAKKNYSDSWGFFKEFQKGFKKSKEQTREKKIRQTIKNLLKEKTGSFSIAIYDKIEKVIYYFKNSSTNMSFYRTKNKQECYLATNKMNEDFLSQYGKFNSSSFYDYKIYKIYIEDNKILFSIIGTIKEPKINITYAQDFYKNWEDRQPIARHIKKEEQKG